MSRSLRLLVLVVVAALGGTLLAVVAYFLFFKAPVAWINLVLWTLIAVAMGWRVRSGLYALIGSAVMGFCIVFVYSMLGYAAAAPIIHALPVFAMLGIVGAIGMAAASSLSYWIRTLTQRRRRENG